MSQRYSILALVILCHALALWYLAVLTETKSTLRIQHTQSIQVEFIERVAPVKVAPKDPPTDVAAVEVAPKGAPKDIAVVEVAPKSAPTDIAAVEAGAKGAPTEALKTDISKHALDAFLANGQSRQFDVQRPGLDDMKKLLDRPVALEYKSTRFEADWQGDRPRLERVLEKAIEKSTATVKIPIPGRPGAYLRCSIAVLALGGGCGFTANDDGYFVKADDPDTLSPEEDRQCAAWWDLIVSANSQDVWRKTRDLYARECKKPLAKP